MNNWLLDLLKELGLFFKDILAKKNPPAVPPAPTPVQPPVVEVPTPLPPPVIPPLLPRQKLYLTAMSSVGIDASPNDIAPDEYGCMETVDTLYKKTFGKYISGSKITVSTYIGLGVLLKSPRFKRVYELKPGVIIICATGYSHLKNTPIPNGHVGIAGFDKIIFSNNSLTGQFDDHYTLTTWTNRYVVKGGYDIYMFEPV